MICHYFLNRHDLVHVFAVIEIRRFTLRLLGQVYCDLLNFCYLFYVFNFSGSPGRRKSSKTINILLTRQGGLFSRLYFVVFWIRCTQRINIQPEALHLMHIFLKSAERNSISQFIASADDFRRFLFALPCFTNSKNVWDLCHRLLQPFFCVYGFGLCFIKCSVFAELKEFSKISSTDSLSPPSLSRCD